MSSFFSPIMLLLFVLLSFIFWVIVFAHSLLTFKINLHSKICHRDKASQHPTLTTGRNICWQVSSSSSEVIHVLNNRSDKNPFWRLSGRTVPEAADKGDQQGAVAHRLTTIALAMAKRLVCAIVIHDLGQGSSLEAKITAAAPFSRCPINVLCTLSLDA